MWKQELDASNLLLLLYGYWIESIAKESSDTDGSLGAQKILTLIFLLARNMNAV